MAFPRPQAPQDWLTQAWHIAAGRRLDPVADAWLLGPIGEIGGIADRFVDKLAEREGLSIQRSEPGSGLLEGFDAFPGVREAVHPAIDQFYRHTSDYDFDVWSEWQPAFGGLGSLVARIFTRRIQQLNLPRRPLDTAWGVSSEIIVLRDSQGARKYTIWFRRLKKTGEVIYSGVYADCVLPGGERCLKVVFPLPQGNATVVMRLRADDAGNLELLSHGRRCGEAGFYFVVQDSSGKLWMNYLGSFQERIFVQVDPEGVLRADHAMTVWNLRAYDLHYKLSRRR
ncbi:MAG TPA: hypothetical protein PLS03_01545 [Terrimicrobiaceae bacterium]|nr:hypothetical protein [Terrimicrobiaceae bacterium]